MRPLRHSINVISDGCRDHREFAPDEDLHRHAGENVARPDAVSRSGSPERRGLQRRERMGSFGAPMRMSPWAHLSGPVSAVPLLFMLLLGVPSTALPSTLRVRADGYGDFPNIQAAIDSSGAGDTISLGDGAFRGAGNRDLQWSEKALVIRSESGDPTLTTIDCEGSAADHHRAITLDHAATLPSIVEGITFVNGYKDGDWEPEASGGAIYVEPMYHPGTSSGTGPTFRRCRFEHNVALTGAAIYCTQASPEFVACDFVDNEVLGGDGTVDLQSNSSSVLTDCVFLGNRARDVGGALALNGSPSTITRCTFYGNSAAWAGAVILGGSSVRMIESTLLNNAATHDVCGGIMVRHGSTFTGENLIIAGCPSGQAIYCDFGGSAELSCCDLFGNAGGDWTQCVADQLGAAGNISADPLICDPESGDFGLSVASPCVAGDTGSCGQIGAWGPNCQDTPVLHLTWGAIKARYRR